MFLCQTKYALNLLMNTKMSEAHSNTTVMAVGTTLFVEDNPSFDDPIKIQK